MHSKKIFNLQVLKKQAAKTSKEYMKLLDGDQGKDATMAELKKEVEELRVKSKDLEVVKKQAERTTKGMSLHN